MVLSMVRMRVCVRARFFLRAFRVRLEGGRPTNTPLAVRPGGRCDVTATHRLWIQRPANNKT